MKRICMYQGKDIKANLIVHSQLRRGCGRRESFPGSTNLIRAMVYSVFPLTQQCRKFSLKMVWSRQAQSVAGEKIQRLSGSMALLKPDGEELQRLLPPAWRSALGTMLSSAKTV